MRKLLVITASLIGLAACSLIPDYHRPNLPVASAWPATPASSANGSVPTADLGWRAFFADPVAQELVALSLANNRDLRVAALNVDQAQAQYRVDRASLFPTIDGTAGYEAARTPGDVYGTSSPQNIRQYSLGVGAVSWELDLFGRIRSQAAQASESFLSDVETQRSTQISLVAQVGAEYLTWLADRDALAVSRDTAKAQGDSLRLTQLKTAHGSATALDVAQAETTLRSAEASVAQYTRQLAQDMDELVLLVGRPLPEDLVTRLNTAPSLDAEPRFPDLPPGLPADLLKRRPDIRAAEHTLIGANANIGAARAAFFPQVSLTANYGTDSSGLRRLFRAGQASWLFEPQISVPIFDFGSNQSNLDIAKIEARSDIANYEKTIQSAFHDVADALAARDTYISQLAAQQALVSADARYYHLSDMRFRAGADTYLNVLVAQNSLFSAQLSLIGLKLSALQNSVTLYKALGGGWQENSVRTAASATSHPD